VKDEMIKEGKDTSLGAIVSLVSIKWKALSDSERERYEKLAREDRTRYDAECAARDEEVYRRQEEKRKQNSMTETETRMRGSTMALTDAITCKADAPKKARVVSEQEREKIAERRQVIEGLYSKLYSRCSFLVFNIVYQKARSEEESTMKKSIDDVKAAKAAQAEARYSCILIFKKFRT